MTELSTNHLSSAAAGQAAATAPLQPAVVLVAFTGDGQGLVTVDVRPATGQLRGGDVTCHLGGIGAVYCVPVPLHQGVFVPFM